MNLRKSIITFLKDNFAVIKLDELILDVDQSGPLQITPEERVLVSVVVLDKDEIAVTEGTDYTVDKKAGTITLIGGSWITGDAFIVQSKSRPVGNFTNNVDLIDIRKEGIDETKPSIFVQAWPSIYKTPFNTRAFRPRILEDGSAVMERKRMFKAKVQLDIFAQDEEQNFQMWQHLFDVLGAVAFIPYLTFRQGPKEIGKVMLQFNPTIVPEWDDPRTTLDFMAIVEIVEQQPQLTIADNVLESLIDGELIPVIIPTPGDILQFNVDHLYTSSPDPSIEDSDWLFYFG